MAIEDIKVMDVNRFHNYLMNASLSKSYITKCRAMLIHIFDFAEANELFKTSPARKSKAIKNCSPYVNEEVESKKDAFSEVEQNLLISTCLIT